MKMSSLELDHLITFACNILYFPLFLILVEIISSNEIGHQKLSAVIIDAL